MSTPDMPTARQVLRSTQMQRLLAARVVSNVGNGVAPIALAFGVLALPGATASSLSLVLAAQAIPLIIVLPLGGVIADRLGRARVIAGSDLILGVLVVAMGVLFITGMATVPVLAGMSVVAGALNGLWYPAFAGLVPDVVPDEHLQPANALVSIGSNSGMILGSALGGVLVTVVGAGPAIALDGLTFIIGGALIASIRRSSRPHDSGESALSDLVHGWRVFWSYRWVVVIVLAFSFIVMVLRGSEEVLGPVLALERYGGPAGWSVVLGFMFAGLLVGGLLGSRLRVARPLVVGMLACLTLPAWLLTLAFQLPLPIVAGASLCWGVAIELFAVLWYTAMQTHIPREALSRVASYDAFGSLMFGPVGLAIAGPLVGVIGLKGSFLAAAGVAILAIGASVLSSSVRSLRG